MTHNIIKKKNKIMIYIVFEYILCVNKNIYMYKWKIYNQFIVVQKFMYLFMQKKNRYNGTFKR